MSAGWLSALKDEKSSWSFLRRSAARLFSNNTPSRLELMMALSILGSILMAITSVICTQEHFRAVKSVGLDAAPSVIAAFRIKTAAEALDADLADQLLATASDPENSRFAKDFEAHRLNVARGLIDAARNVTFGDAEGVPLQTLQQSFTSWLQQAQSALDFHKAGRPDDAVSMYRTALQTLQQSSMPAADALNKANSDALENAYQQAGKLGTGIEMFLLVIVSFVAICLIYTQYFLRMRFRRRLNPYLCVATIISIIFGYYSLFAYHNCWTNLKRAKQDAYDSVVALLTARSDSYDANVAESRWLLDAATRPAYEQDFFEKAGRVAKADKGATLEKAQASTTGASSTTEKIQIKGIHGALADELNNISFPGEGQAALDTFKKFVAYYQADCKVRQFENSGKHREAVRFCLSYKPGESNGAFEEFDQALEKVLAINEKCMRDYVQLAFHNLDGLVPFAVIVSILNTVLVFFGLRPRLKEY